MISVLLIILCVLIIILFSTNLYFELVNRKKITKLHLQIDEMTKKNYELFKKTVDASNNIKKFLSDNSET